MKPWESNDSSWPLIWPNSANGCLGIDLIRKKETALNSNTQRWISTCWNTLIFSINGQRIEQILLFFLIFPWQCIQISSVYFQPHFYFQMVKLHHHLGTIVAHSIMHCNLNEVYYQCQFSLYKTFYFYCLTAAMVVQGNQYRAFWLCITEINLKYVGLRNAQNISARAILCNWEGH